jgi:hypothetical protein
MGKLIKIVVLLAIVAGGVFLAVKFAGGFKKGGATAAAPAAKEPAPGGKKTAPEVQEKYGFAPANPLGN